MPSSVARKAKTRHGVTSGKRMLRLPEVMGRTGRSKPGIYAMIREGTFPPPKRIGKRAVAWEEDKVDAWVGGLATCEYAPVPSPEPAAAIPATPSKAKPKNTAIAKAAAESKAAATPTPKGKPSPMRSAPTKAAAIAA